MKVLPYENPEEAVSYISSTETSEPPKKAKAVWKGQGAGMGRGQGRGSRGEKYGRHAQREAAKMAIQNPVVTATENDMQRTMEIRSRVHSPTAKKQESSVVEMEVSKAITCRPPVAAERR